MTETVGADLKEDGHLPDVLIGLNTNGGEYLSRRNNGYTGIDITKLMPFEIERKPFLRQRLMKSDRRKLERGNPTALSSVVFVPLLEEMEGARKESLNCGGQDA